MEKLYGTAGEDLPFGSILIVSPIDGKIYQIRDGDETPCGAAHRHIRKDEKFSIARNSEEFNQISPE